jgi:hypothetical protein
MNPQTLVRRLRAQPDQVRVIRQEVRDFAREHDDDEERPDAAADRDAATAAHAAAVLHLAGIEPCSGTELHAAGPSLVSAHVRARVHNRAGTGPGLRTAVCPLA